MAEEKETPQIWIIGWYPHINEVLSISFQKSINYRINYLSNNNLNIKNIMLHKQYVTLSILHCQHISNKDLRWFTTPLLSVNICTVFIFSFLVKNDILKLFPITNSNSTFSNLHRFGRWPEEKPFLFFYLSSWVIMWAFYYTQSWS